MKVYDLGLISYEKASAVQEKLVNNRLSGLITSDILLFAEHYPVITIGRDGHKENLLLSPELCANLNITLAEANRGGDITYHGPGQIICYPIVKLKGPEQDVLQLIRNYETAVMFTLKTFSIESERMNGLTGVWVGSKKIAAIGVAIKNWVSLNYKEEKPITLTVKML